MNAVRVYRSIVAAVVAGGLWGCSPGVDLSPCVSDADCGPEAICALGQCVDPSDQRLSTVDLEIRPPESAGLPTQIVLGIDLARQPRVDVTLRPGVRVRGTVTQDGEPLRADVVALGTERIPGRASAPSTATDEDGAFELLCVDGASYALSIFADNPAVAPYYDDVGIRPRGGASGVDALEPVTLTAPRIWLRGRVTAGVGVAAQGIDHLAVRALADGRRVSSIGETGDVEDGSAGEFRVALSAGVDPVARLLDLAVAPTDANALFPALTLTVDTLSATVEETEDGTVYTLQDIDLGEVEAPVEVAVALVTLDGRAVGDARVVASGAVGAGTVRREATTDEAGRAVLALPPAHYDLAIIPHDGDTAGSLLTGLDAVARADAVVVRLPTRSAVEGTLVDADGGLVSSAGLTLVRVALPDGTAPVVLGDVRVQAVATTSDLGAFQLLADPGRYRVDVRPPASSGAPPTSFLLDIGNGAQDLTVTLPPAAFVAGEVRLAGAPVGLAFVRAFSRFLDESGQAILLGEGTADVDGAFSLLVPDLAPGTASSR